jgi:hypothetical protein
LASIEVPKDLGPEDFSAPSSSSEKKEAAPEKKEEKKDASSKKEEPKEEKSAPAKEEPSHGNGHKVVKHSKPLFPSVSRL